MRIEPEGTGCKISLCQLPGLCYDEPSQSFFCDFHKHPPQGCPLLLCFQFAAAGKGASRLTIALNQNQDQDQL
jgi:hypothetical protein